MAFMMSSVTDFSLFQYISYPANSWEQPKWALQGEKLFSSKLVVNSAVVRTARLSLGQPLGHAECRKPPYPSLFLFSAFKAHTPKTNKNQTNVLRNSTWIKLLFYDDHKVMDQHLEIRTNSLQEASDKNLI
ncbi:CLUMA_CG008629, isoform A [Clunio marinus]|uniref:CLUMA_CG008629, isoform A n=1 Tax=Clunio marinus TaxID=568069 RepID=A0A1J1I4C0_9DIPT|nr:CLUMA_CG008629, isoform A [Clunio marinus]